MLLGIFPGRQCKGWEVSQELVPSTHEDWTSIFYLLEGHMIWLIPFQNRTFLHKVAERMAASSKIWYESSDICQATLKTTELLEIFWLRHLLDRFDLRLVDLNPSVMNNETQEFPKSDAKCAFEWVHLQPATLQSFKNLSRSHMCSTLFLDLTTKSST